MHTQTRIIVGRYRGAVHVSQGNTWSSIDSSGFVDAKTKDTALAAGLVVTELIITNSHTTQYLVLKLMDGTGLVDTNDHDGIYVGPSDSLTLSLNGEQVTDISYQGSAAATTAKLTASFVDAGG